MYEIYVQAIVQFAFQILNRTVNVLFYLLYFKYLLTREAVTCFLWFSDPRQAWGFFHFTDNKGKQIIVALYKMQDLD